MPTQHQITNVCLAVATATFMYFTYLYKRDVDIKVKMFSNYDVTNNDELETLEIPFHVELSSDEEEILNKNN